MDKATIHFRRTDAGDVIGEIVGENGEIFVTKNFGGMTDEEMDRVLEAFQAEHPEALILPVKLTCN